MGAISEGTAAEQYAAAKKVVYDRLAVRSRSRFELEQTLLSKGADPEIAAVVLGRCEAAGLVDDREFARSWIEGRQRSKGLAAGVLRLELRRHGVADDLISEVLDGLDPEAERQAAHRLVQAKLRSLQGLDATTQIRRLTGLLARKGYAPQVAFDVVRAELDASELFDDVG